MNVYWESIHQNLRSILSYLGQQSYIKRFYLAGGTALALQLGHRKSVDLDFFSENDEVGKTTRTQIIKSFLKDPFQGQVIEDVDGNLLLSVNQTEVGFFGYGYPLIEPLHEMNTIPMAGIIDIGLMKLDALTSRGSRKDFYDLFWIAREVPIGDLLEFGNRKYPFMRDFPLIVIEHMVNFENADRDVQPVLFKHTPWEEVREFFINQVKELGSKWFF